MSSQLRNYMKFINYIKKRFLSFTNLIRETFFELSLFFRDFIFIREKLSNKKENCICSLIKR